MGKKGFTLIELLVVIAIIALLMAIIMPALGKVKDQAKGIICMSNLRQWHLCFQNYLADNENTFAAFSRGGEGWQGWIDKLYPYFEDTGAFICPATKIENQGFAVGSNGGYSGTVFTTWRAVYDSQSRLAESSTGLATVDGSYGYNYWVGSIDQQTLNSTNNTFTRDTSLFWRTDSISGGSTSQIPLLGDCMWAGAAPGPPGWQIAPRDEANPEPATASAWKFNGFTNRYLLPRHCSGKTMQMICLDGHSEKVPMKQRLWEFNWHKEWPRSNDWNRQSAAWPQWIENLD